MRGRSLVGKRWGAVLSTEKVSQYRSATAGTYRSVAREVLPPLSAFGSGEDTESPVRCATSLLLRSNGKDKVPPFLPGGSAISAR